ncbi:WD40 repeat domain-containing protein [Streptomyces sp. NBC_01264]|uniref:WD40 repeat domain-containing protein n=1 Tax=Streptomyces sp. NBC_01264 TaxID=2903804 RepID=UPI0022579DD3|nr:hypothetical protein [Streptomyces sp. NBC_01264]MCX4781179.1 hypothetical protein [Streptomyces sp. NBC_01264]
MKTLKATSEPKSLFWEGEDLVDPLGGFRRWAPDGREHDFRPVLSYRFDHAVRSPSGRWTVIYEERGTKALLLEGVEIIRELDRSFYHAEEYDYPVALGALPDGREVLVHCPDAYDTPVTEDAATGERLTPAARYPEDIFHSRLAVSPDGRRLLSAGWEWYPFGALQVFDLAAAVAGAAELDCRGRVSQPDGQGGEVVAACWLDGDRVAVATGEVVLHDEGGEQPAALGPQEIGVWSAAEERWLHRSPLGFTAGTLLACGGDRVVSLCGHPRLVDARTGSVLAEWPEVPVSHRVGSYGVPHVPTPVVALHPDGIRLAVAQEGGIRVLDLPQT